MKKYLALAVALAALPISQAPPAQADPVGVVPLAAVQPDDDDAASFEGRTYFPGDTAGSGNELWVTDGTPLGTHMVVDLAPGVDDANPEALTAFRGRLYFSAWTAATGQELWSTDGTAAGTQLVADAYAGPGSSVPLELTVAGDRLYFAASDPVHGRELWASDGTAPGTRLIAEIGVGVGSGNPMYLTKLGDRVVYRANTTPTAQKPFVTGPGITVAQQLDPLRFDLDLSVGEFAVLGDRVVFRAGPSTTGAELWVSRGQPGDARAVKDIDPGIAGSSPNFFVTYGEKVLFAASSSDTGRELWATDGTEAGTVLVRDIFPASAPGTPQYLTRVGDQVVFTAIDGVHGRELWATRGTAASTHLVTDAYPGPAGGALLELGNQPSAAGQLLYPGVDGQGAEPWVTDGVTARPLADLAPGVLSSRPNRVGVVGNVVVFGANDGATDRLYGWTSVGSTTAVTAKRKYAAKQARKKRIVLPVTVSSTTGEPVSGGTVTLTRNGKVVGSAPLVNGSARVRITVRLKAGRTHLVTATWSGVDSVVTGSVSEPARFKIKKKHR
jgi:ELWxxDGT repeat protein